MVVKTTCKLYIENNENKSIAGSTLVHQVSKRSNIYEPDNKNTSEQCNQFLCPKYVSQAWIERFKILEFTIDQEGYLFSPKSYNETWDVHTKALWFRSIGISPTKIAKKLNVDIDNLTNHWLSNITKYYPLRGGCKYDWATIGYSDLSENRYVKYGGMPSHTSKQAVAPYQVRDIGQMEMDTDLNMLRLRYKIENEDDSADCG